MVPKLQFSRGQRVTGCPQNIGLENVALRRGVLSLVSSLMYEPLLRSSPIERVAES